VPPLFYYIEDRDLYTLSLEGTQSIAKGLKMYPDWKDWIEYLYKPQQLAEAGISIQRFLDVQSETIIKHPPILWDLTGDVVPIYNLPGFMISDTLAMALEKYPTAYYAVGYIDLHDKIIYSLRSRKDTDMDVSEIAKRFGGGGHKHASGFVLKKNS
jgi:hypothetical protein